MALGDGLKLVCHRRGLFAISAVACTLTVLIGSTYVPVSYTGTAAFALRTDMSAEETLRRSGESPSAFRLRLQDELAGRAAIERAADDLVPAKDAANGPGGGTKADLVRRFRNAVEVDWDIGFERPDRIAVRFTDRDPTLAREVPERLVKGYVTLVSERITVRLAANRDLLEKQLGEYRSRLAELTRQQAPPQPQPPPEPKAAPLPPADNTAAVQQQIRQIGADMEAIRRRQAEAQQKLERLKAEADAPRPMDKPVQVVKGPSPEWTALKEQRRRLQEELDAAVSLKHMTDNHPTVQGLKKKIQDLTERMDRLPQEVVLQTIYGPGPAKDGLSEALTAAQAEVEAATRELDGLQKRLVQVQNLLAGAPPPETPPPPQRAPQPNPQLLKQIEETRTEVARIEPRVAESQTAVEVERSCRRDQIAAVLSAEARPTFPVLWQVLGLALVGGPLFGVAVVFLASATSRRIESAEDAARRFDIPVLGVTSLILSQRERARRRLNRFLLVPAVVLAVSVAILAATVNVAVWLEWPERYGDWRASPASFVCNDLLGGDRGPARP